MSTSLTESSPGAALAATGAPRVSWRERIAYGIGGLPAGFGDVGLKSLAIPVYQMTLKVDPALLGLVLALPRFWDAVTDPAMGWLSDRTRSRFGRRRPYIVVGALLTGVAFALVWMVPVHWTQGAQLSWFLVMALLFYTCLTIWAVPYHSLGYEIAAGYHERTAVMGVRSVFLKLAGFSYQWMFPLAQLAVFASAMQGVRVVTVCVAAGIFMLLGMLPGLLVRERFSGAGLAPPATPVRFWASFTAVARNRGMLVITLLTLLKLVAGVFASSLDYYLIVYYVFDGDIARGSIWKGVLSSAHAAIALAGLAPLAWFSRRYDKRSALTVLYSLAVVGGLAKWFVFQPGVPWLMLLDPLLNAPLQIGITMIVPSMVADICDEDEWRHGQRREGMYGSLLSWVQKSAISLAFLGSGVTLSLSGFDAALGGRQSSDAIFWMRVTLVAVTAGAAIIALLVLSHYPLNERRMTGIRRGLETRRGIV